MNSVQDPGGQRYGCLELKKSVGPNLLRGLVVAVLLHGMAGASPMMIRMFFGVWPLPEQTIYPQDEKPLEPIPAPPRERPQGHSVPLDLTQVVPERFQRAIPVDDESKDVTPLPTAPATPGDDPLNPDSLGGGTSTSGGGLDPRGFVGLMEDTIPPPELFIPVEIQPQPLTTNPLPGYPDLARLSGISGDVVVNVFVDKHGDVKRHKLLRVRPANLGFEDAVDSIITKWKFTPAIQQGTPVGVWVTVPFKFRLGN